jgi:cold shock CspA family protein
MTGKITRIHRAKGFGVIVGDDEADYIFYRSALQDDEFDELLEGAAVSFDPVHGQTGAQAKVVRLVRQNES